MTILEYVSLVVCFAIGVFLLTYNSDPISSLTLSEGFGYLFMGIGILYSISLGKKHSPFTSNKSEDKK